MYPIAEFEAARQAYPGTKRGFDAEYSNYQKKLKKFHLKESDVSPLLLTAIQFQIKERQGKNWNADWKHFSTWINNRWWEAVSDTGKKAEKVCHGCGGPWSSTVMHPDLRKEVPVCWPCKQNIRGY